MVVDLIHILLVHKLLDTGLRGKVLCSEVCDYQLQISFKKTKNFKTHHLWTMNIYTKFYGYLASSHRDILEHSVRQANQLTDTEVLQPLT